MTKEEVNAQEEYWHQKTIELCERLGEPPPERETAIPIPPGFTPAALEEAVRAGVFDSDAENTWKKTDATESLETRIDGFDRAAAPETET